MSRKVRGRDRGDWVTKGIGRRGFGSRVRLVRHSMSKPNEYAQARALKKIIKTSWKLPEDCKKKLLF